MKIRLRYSRHGKVRFTSHRDTARIMERAFRKLRLPIAYTEGFSPRPKVSFGLALTVAHESEAEYLDIDLVTPIDLEGLADRLTEALPDGLTVDVVAPIEPRTASLQQAVVCCRWSIEVLDASLDDVTAAVSALLAAPERLMERERKGKTSVVDVRPSVLEVEVAGPTDHGVQLYAVLATGERTLRPSEFIRLLGLDLREGRVCRTHQWTNAEGERIEPLDPRRTSDATISDVPKLDDSARPAKVRVS